MKNILVTGGAGYIGTHTLIELVAAGFHPIVYDNLSNANPIALHRVAKITGVQMPFVQGDVRDKAMLDDVFDRNDIDAVIHFAGLKAVGESVREPLTYYQNNVTGTLNVLEAMQKSAVKRFIFSSSATVYGDPDVLPIDENAKRSATNPYGRSKLMIEQMLEDLTHADHSWQVMALRYFNPIGAHKSGKIGEDPGAIPNNLMPYISQVAVGKLAKLAIFGADYATQDGTGVRDYIHVVDLARGHVKALEYLLGTQRAGFLPVNLGTGQGTSVLELVNAFVKTTGQTVPYVITDRRAGDIAMCYASAERARTLLGWTAEFGTEEMCRDTWHWQMMNPDGYGHPDV